MEEHKREAKPKGQAALQAIEELQEKHNVTKPVLEGMKALNRWRAGYQIAEGAFLKAMELFLKAPVDGRKEENR